jgi:HEAT repeat protein
MANLDGAFASAFGTLLGGAFIVGFVKLCGGGDLWIGIVSALGSLLGIVQIPGAIYGRQFKSYKNYIWPGGLIWRLLYTSFIVLPLVPIPGQAKLILLVVVITVASTSVLVCNPIYNDWLAELVPPQSRGTFFSNRNAITTAVGATIGIGGGFLLDFMKAHHWEAQGYSAVFGLGCMMGLVSFYFFFQMKDLEREEPVRTSLRDGIIAIGAPFRDKAYRPVLIFLVAAVFGQGFPGALWSAYALETLKLPFGIIQLTGACQALGIVVSARFWGFASDKYGNRPILVLACILLALNPIPWMLCRPNALVFDSVLLLVAHVFFGVSWGAINLCQFNILLSTAKPSDRANYLGAGMAVSALVGGIAPLAGAGLMASLRESLGDPQRAYEIVFGIDIFLRIGATFFLAKVREAGSSHLATTLRQLTSATPSRVRALRKLSRSGDAEEREEALETLSEETFAMASDEMIRALNDPLPRVRRQAALALSRLREPSTIGAAVGALIEQLQLHPDLVEEETIEALGTIGDPRAATPLIRTLQSPRSLLRRAAARALGRLGNKEAIPALIEVARDGDADIRRAAFQALRLLEAREAWQVVSEGVLDDRPSVRVAAAEAVAELELFEARDSLRQSLARFPNEGASSVAYALGVVGAPEDLGLVMLIAAGRQRVVSRRQALLGAAQLLRAEGTAYRLMLLEGMERDNAISELLRPLVKRSRRAAVALNLYSSGDEPGALKALSSAVPGLSALTEFPVEEGFLVAVAASIVA